MIERYLLYGALVASILGAVWFHGYTRGELLLSEYRADQARASVALVIKQGETTERVVTRYIKVQAESQNVEEAVKKGVEAYAAANAGMCLDAAWRGLHDRAATNSIPEPGPATDDPAGAPTAATALETVTFNYAACHRTADRLDALQAWVREQQKVK